MSRSRCSPRAASNTLLPVQQMPSATISDAVAIMRITNSGVSAIVAEAAKYGLDGTPCYPESLHPKIANVAHPSRRRRQWWSRSLPEKEVREELPDDPVATQSGLSE